MLIDQSQKWHIAIVAGAFPPKKLHLYRHTRLFTESNSSWSKLSRAPRVIYPIYLEPVSRTRVRCSYLRPMWFMLRKVDCITTTPLSQMSRCTRSIHIASMGREHTDAGCYKSFGQRLFRSMWLHNLKFHAFLQKKASPRKCTTWNI